MFAGFAAQNAGRDPALPAAGRTDGGAGGSGRSNNNGAQEDTEFFSHQDYCNIGHALLVGTSSAVVASVGFGIGTVVGSPGVGSFFGATIGGLVGLVVGEIVWAQINQDVGCN